MLTEKQVNWLKAQPMEKKEEIERKWLSYIVPEGSTVAASPNETDQWDATVTIGTAYWWCENKMRFVSEGLVLNGGGGKPAGLLTDLKKVEFLYNTGHGVLIHYFPKEDCAYVARIGDPSSYVTDTGWYPKNNYSDEMELKTVCYIPVTERNRRATDIAKWMRRDAEGD